MKKGEKEHTQNAHTPLPTTHAIQTKKNVRVCGRAREHTLEHACTHTHTCTHTQTQTSTQMLDAK